MGHKQVGSSAGVAAGLVVVALGSGQAGWLALAGLAAVLTLGLARRTRQDRLLLGGAAVAVGLVALQALLPPVLYWLNGMALLGCLSGVALAGWLGGEPQGGNRAFRALSLLAMALTYLCTQITFFALPTNRPLAGDFYGVAEQLAVGALGMVSFLLVRRALARQHHPVVRRLALASSLAYVLYLALVLSPLWAGQVAHPSALLAASALSWSLAVALVVAVLRLPNRALTAAAPQVARPLPVWRVTLNDYLTLMKVRVASLLLVTTLGGMVIAAQGWPGWSLVGWVMLGGLLSVGGAGAINHYLDRDIDGEMGRTSQRPIPAGRVAPGHALAFGLLLSVLQFAIFWFKVNALAAWLATGGLLYYVVIYTLWLKRTSMQNIVIGGAAGAFPPLVGWAAVTGNLSLGALFLFAIVFYWTPPHFWALALMRKSDYARVGVPMLPVVVGEAETRRQILLYSLLMFGLTLMLVPLQLMGFLYLAASLLLNGKFLWDALRLYQEPSNQRALTLYKYSLLYLALLFVAMAVDRALVV